MSNREPGNLRVVVGYESAFNSGQTTPAGYDIPKASCSFGASEEIGESDEIKSDPNPMAPIRGMWSTAGDLVECVEDQGLGILAKAFLTGYAKDTVTVAPFGHTLTISSTAPASLWVEVGDTGVDKYDLYKGVLIRSLAVSVTKVAQVVKATWSLIGSGDKTLNTTEYDSSPSTFTVERGYMRDATVTIGTTLSELVTGINFTVSRDIQMPKVLDGLTYSPSYVAGAYTVKGQITALFDSTDEFRAYVTGDTEVKVKLRCPRPGAPTKYVEFQFNEAKIGLSQAPSISGRGGMVQVTCDLYGYYQDDAGASAFTLVLANDQSTSY